MKIIGLITAFLGIILFEIPGMVKDKMWKELAVFSGLLVVGLILAFAAVLNIKLPNPTAFLDLIFGPLSKAMQAIFQ